MAAKPGFPSPHHSAKANIPEALLGAVCEVGRRHEQDDENFFFVWSGSTSVSWLFLKGGGVKVKFPLPPFSFGAKVYYRNDASRPAGGKRFSSSRVVRFLEKCPGKKASSESFPPPSAAAALDYIYQAILQRRGLKKSSNE